MHLDAFDHCKACWTREWCHIVLRGVSPEAFEQARREGDKTFWRTLPARHVRSW
jgi:hypothetical protein